MSLGRPFRALLAANGASNLADGLAFVSMPLLAASITDDPRWVGVLATIYSLVRLLVALPIGVWVDRTDRRTLLVAANLLRGGALLALAMCFLFDFESLALLYVAFAIIGTRKSRSGAEGRPPRGCYGHLARGPRRDTMAPAASHRRRPRVDRWPGQCRLHVAVLDPRAVRTAATRAR